MIVALGAAGQAGAAGFYIKETSITGLGRAFAGGVAAASDASTVWFNPAGISDLPRNEAIAGVSVLILDTELTNAGSLKSNGTTFQPISDSGAYNPYEPTPIPNLFVVMKDVQRGLSLGVGVTAPFGLANEYPETWFGRYDSIETHLKTINYSVVGAYDFGRVTIGGGVDYQTADATMSSMKNAVTQELYSELHGEAKTFGFNVGVLADLTPDTRVGMHYRSGFTHELEGTAVVRVGSSGGPQYDTYKAIADLRLPAMLSAGVSHRMTDRFTLLGDVTYYEWSTFDALKVYNASTGALKEDTAQNYQDTLSFGLGFDYAYSDALTFRAGAQYDPTPTRNGFRTSRTPDSDRLWVSGGLSVRLTDNVVLDAALSYVHAAPATLGLRRSATAGGTTTAIVQADIDSSTTIAAIGLRCDF